MDEFIIFISHILDRIYHKFLVYNNKSDLQQ